MLQKFKITSIAFILCLFGLTLMTVSQVFADDINLEQRKDRYNYGRGDLLPSPSTGGLSRVNQASAKLTLLIATIEKRIDQLQAKGNKSNWEEDLLRQARDIQGFICPSSYSCR